MAKFQGKEQDGKLIISKGYEKMADENKELSEELDYITKEELIDAVKKLANELGIQISFTYDNKKNKI